jgi:hypothetical protein
VKTDGCDSGCDSIENACKSFGSVLLIESGKKYLKIKIIGSTFQNENFSIPSNYSIYIENEEEKNNEKVKLSYYSIDGTNSPYITMGNSLLTIKNMTIIFNETNKGPFISLTSIFLIFLTFILFIFLFY